MKSSNRIAAIVAELQEVAGVVERSDPRTAARIDVCCNTIESRSRRRAGLNDELVPHFSSDRNPGDEDADEGARYEKHEQWVKPGEYHRFPIGPRSVSQGMTMGWDNKTKSPRQGPIKSITDIDTDFASEDPVIIQAGKTRKPQRQAACDEDEGDPLDDLTTGGLPSSGHDFSVDEHQEGTKLPYRGVGPYKGKVGSKNQARTARAILERVAGPVIVKDPRNLHRDEPGDEVVRDQDLGGQTDKEGYEMHYPEDPNTAMRMPGGGEDFDFVDGDEPVEMEEVDMALDGHDTDEHADYSDTDGGGMMGPGDDDMGPEDDGLSMDEADEDDDEMPPPPPKKSKEASRQRPRVATVNVYRPKFVPTYLKGVWIAAAHHVAAAGNLVDDRGRVNYGRVTAAYTKALESGMGNVNKVVAGKKEKPQAPKESPKPAAKPTKDTSKKSKKAG